MGHVEIHCSGCREQNREIESLKSSEQKVQWPEWFTLSMNIQLDGWPLGGFTSEMFAKALAPILGDGTYVSDVELVKSDSSLQPVEDSERVKAIREFVDARYDLNDGQPDIAQNELAAVLDFIDNGPEPLKDETNETVSIPVGSVPPWMKHAGRSMNKGDLKFYLFKDTSEYNYDAGIELDLVAKELEVEDPDNSDIITMQSWDAAERNPEEPQADKTLREKLEDIGGDSPVKLAPSQLRAVEVLIREHFDSKLDAIRRELEQGYEYGGPTWAVGAVRAHLFGDNQ